MFTINKRRILVSILIIVGLFVLFKVVSGLPGEGENQSPLVTDYPQDALTLSTITDIAQRYYGGQVISPQEQSMLTSAGIIGRNTAAEHQADLNSIKAVGMAQPSDGGDTGANGPLMPENPPLP